MRFAIFALTLLAVLAAVNLFVYRRAAESFAWSIRTRRIVAVILAGGVVALFTGRIIALTLPGRVAAVVAGGGWVLELGVVLAAAAMAVERLSSWSFARLRRVGRGRRDDLPPATAAPLSEPPVDGALTRREIVTRAAAGTALALGGSTAGYGGLFGRHDYVLEEVPIRLSKLPRALDGFTIAQLSDIHIGLFVGDPEMNSAVELVRRAKPDVVVITGDMIDIQEEMAPALGRLVRALSAIAPVAAIPGNHDYYAGIGATLGSVADGGGTVLLNRAMRVGEGRIVLSGVDDMWAWRYAGRGPRLEQALAGAPSELPRILLAHQPVFFERSAPHVDLQLSGHTHGGQFNPGFNPARLVLPNGWVAGRYRTGDAQLYVNRGFGTAGPPARLGAAPEVTRIVLTT